MTARASISHSVPGRLRMRVGRGTSAERSQALTALHGIEDQPGVSSVTTDERTGSALLTYDPDRLDPEAALELVRKAHQAFATLAPPQVSAAVDAGLSQAGQTIRQRFGSWDSRVRRATGGTVDLRALVPIGLAGLSLRQLLTQGIGLSSMPWYALAYYSFDSFIKLHGEPARTARPPLPGGAQPS